MTGIRRDIAEVSVWLAGEQVKSKNSFRLKMNSNCEAQGLWVYKEESHFFFINTW